MVLHESTSRLETRYNSRVLINNNCRVDISNTALITSATLRDPEYFENVDRRDVIECIRHLSARDDDSRLTGGDFERVDVVLIVLRVAYLSVFDRVITFQVGEGRTRVATRSHVCRRLVVVRSTYTHSPGN